MVSVLLVVRLLLSVALLAWLWVELHSLALVVFGALSLVAHEMVTAWIRMTNTRMETMLRLMNASRTIVDRETEGGG